MWTDKEVKGIKINENEPNSDQYSNFDIVKQNKNADDDLYEFKLVWPHNILVPNHWRQSSNPYKKSTVTD